MAIWFDFWKNKGIKQEIIGPIINGTISPEIMLEIR
jgi:hypothetical protein